MTDFNAYLQRAGEPSPTGGFLVPTTISVKRPGWRARLWRIAGRRLHSTRLYERGITTASTTPFTAPECYLVTLQTWPGEEDDEHT